MTRPEASPGPYVTVTAMSHPTDPYAPPHHEPGQETGPTVTAASAPDGTVPPAQRPPAPPNLTNGATIHGWRSLPGLRHPAEMPLVWVCVAVSFLIYTGWLLALVWLAVTALAGGPTEVPQTLSEQAGAELYELLTDGGILSQLALVAPMLPIALWIGRAMLYARQRANGVQMSPTQFPEGYRMVVEAAQAFGMRRVPDAYVVLGNGTINAFASGHGFRRFIVVYSDLFEVGGKARDPEALRFVISHEVGHLAAGHVSYLRLLGTQLAAQIPLLGPALSRAQEYTADNFGYALAPSGTPGVMGLLAGGKYLGAQVNLHALADRATREKGLWLHLVVWASSHPVHTWRAHALRDRTRPGRIMIRPEERTAWFPPVQPAGSLDSGQWPTPAQVLEVLDASGPAVPEEQFGRYPGVDYETPRDAVRLADPRPVWT